jgi:hypothetical protein
MRMLSPSRRLVALTALAAIPLSMPGLARAATERTLYAFPSSGAAGCYPDGTLLRDATGALYGATMLCGGYNGGTVFRLKPPSAGETRWTISLLHTFTGGYDGSWPAANLVMDASGALYGTTEFDGRDLQGVVYKLTPPPPGGTKWTETVLHAFHHNFATGDRDGDGPGAGLLMDGSGALYGTTLVGGNPSASGVGFGTVFKLTPPGPGQTIWTETVLYRFAGGSDGENPASTLVADSTGALYGTTLYGGRGTCTDESELVVGCGTVFKLTPPAPGYKAWKKTTLRRFSGGADGGLPHGALLVDSSGALYGTTFQGGTGSCTGGIPAAVIGCGTVYRLTPPQAGETAWSEAVLHNFKGGDGAFPQGGVIKDAAGNLCGTASSGGQYGDGLAFKLSPPLPGKTGWSETVLHQFDISTSGDTPVGELVPDSTGHLYGVAYSGGRGLVGTVFEIVP